MSKLKCCGTCNWCHKDELDDYICVNGDSEYVSDYVEYKHSCPDYAEKQDN